MTFRVQRASLDDTVLLRLSGDIAGDHARELQALLDAEQDQRLILDLAEATVVDRTGVLLLARSESAGARLMNCPAYVREWIDRQREVFARHQQGQGEEEPR
jgi:anti-anti-sigma regulatory factor